MSMIRIDNDGQDIASTNYWQTEHAARGLPYLSVNAGAMRLLVPPAASAMHTSIATAREVIVSAGKWPEQQWRDGVEILFDDDTDSPFAVHLSIEQVDRLPLPSEQGEPIKFTTWGPEGKIWTGIARYRRVKKIPCLKKWGEE